jgi:hypothetical protein
VHVDDNTDKSSDKKKLHLIILLIFVHVRQKAETGSYQTKWKTGQQTIILFLKNYLASLFSCFKQAA